MLVLVYGTTGELIKLLPLLKRLDRDEYITVCTYQQPQQLKQLFENTHLPLPDISLGQKEDAPDLEKMIKIPLWLLATAAGFIKNYRNIKKLIKTSKKNLVVVHGDTMTTVLGSIMGRLLGLKVAHIEAGLRSHNWRHPFPEEIDRVLTSKLARLHFAPGDVPVENLKAARAHGEIINTTYNTVLDSLRLAQKSSLTIDAKLPTKFGVVSIHRNELLVQPDEMKKLLVLLGEFSSRLPLVFIDHPITKERIKNLKLDNLLNSENIIRLPKVSYFSFIQLVSKADCIVTDSGGLQEEAAYLGIPCLVHRKATERQEGLGQNVILSLYDEQAVKKFLHSYKDYKSSGASEKVSPTAIIMKNLQRAGYINEEK